ncbi:hypothetical protein OG21DRAFT_1483771 [Imleria badia]|nr:hypothetical protein OG21DRAFT_1483771 [Imleria badia]
MATAVSRYMPQTCANDSPFNYLDAKTIACHSDGSMVFTLPNMSFVPEPHNGDEELLYCKEFEYTVCIRQSDHHPSPDPLSWAWYRPSVDDFVPLPHAAFPVGQLKQDKATGVASLRKIAGARYDKWKRTRGDKKDMCSQLLKGLDHDLMVLLSLSMMSSSSSLKPNDTVFLGHHGFP